MDMEAGGLDLLRIDAQFARLGKMREAAAFKQKRFTECRAHFKVISIPA